MFILQHLQKNVGKLVFLLEVGKISGEDCICLTTACTEVRRDYNSYALIKILYSAVSLWFKIGLNEAHFV